MKTLFAFLLLISLAARAQYVPTPATAYPALDAALNSRLQFTLGTTLPVACTQGQQIYTDTVTGLMSFCTAANTWTRLNLVPSVFGRTGAIAAASGDYTAAQVTNAVDSTGAYSNPSWITGLAWSKLSGVPSGSVDQVFTGIFSLLSLPNCTAAGGVLQYSTGTHTATCHTLASADVPNNAANTSGNAATATALAATPTLCPGGQAPTGVLTNGNATGCAAIGGGGGGGGTGNAAVKVSVAFSATPTFNCGSTSAGTGTGFLVGTLTGNITSSTLASCTTGQLMYFTFTQDGTGSWTVAMPAGFEACPVNLAANSITTCAYWPDGTATHLVSSAGDSSGPGSVSFPQTPAPILAANAVTLYADTATTTQGRKFAAAPFTGISLWTNTAGRMAETQLSLAAHGVVIGAGAGAPSVTAAGTAGQVLMSNGAAADPTFQALAGGAAATIAAGASALGTASIASYACATVVTTTATGALSTDSIEWSPNASIKAITGYAPASTGGLSIAPYPSAGNVNFDVCNWTASAIVPGALTLNWRIAR